MDMPILSLMMHHSSFLQHCKIYGRFMVHFHFICVVHSVVYYYYIISRINHQDKSQQSILYNDSYFNGKVCHHNVIFIT